MGDLNKHIANIKNDCKGLSDDAFVQVNVGALREIISSLAANGEGGLEGGALQPNYKVGVIVDYIDRHDRAYRGKVLYVQAKWHPRGESVTYCVSHPSYAGGRHYVGDDQIIGEPPITEQSP